MPRLKGFKHSEETRRKMSLAQSGRVLSYEHKQKLSKSHSGKILSEETKRKISITLKGIKRSNEYKRKMSIIAKQYNYGKWMKGRSSWNKGKSMPKGENSTYWKGGISLNKKEYSKNYDKTLNGKISKKRSYNLYRTKTKDLSIRIIQLIYEDNIKQYGTLTCYLCFNPVPFGKDQLEHKIPISRNGTNEYNNLAIVCDKCNQKKHNKTEEEYRELEDIRKEK